MNEFLPPTELDEAAHMPLSPETDDSTKDPADTNEDTEHLLEVEIIYDSPELSVEQKEVFAEHVERTRTSGDPTDRIPYLKRKLWGFRSAASVTAVETPIILVDMGRAALIASVSSVAIAGAIAGYNRRKRFKSAYKAAGMQEQLLLSESYSLITIPAEKPTAKEPGKPQTLALQYHGPIVDQKRTEGQDKIVERHPSIGPRESVRRMAQLAKDNNIDHFLVAEEYAKHVVPQGMDLQKYALSVRDLLAQKRVELDYGKGQDKIIVQSPDFWLKLTDETERRRADDYVTALIQRLPKDNPLAKIYTTYEPFLEERDPQAPNDSGPVRQLLSVKLQAAAREDITRRFSETIKQMPSKGQQVEGSDPRGNAKYLRADFVDGQFIKTFQGQTTERSNVDHFLGIEPGIIEKLAEDPNTKQEEVALFLATHPEAATLVTSLIVNRLELEEKKIAPVYVNEAVLAEDEPYNQHTHDETRPLFDRVLVAKDHIESHPHTLWGEDISQTSSRRLWYGVGASTATFTIAALSLHGLGAYEESASQQIEQQLVQQGRPATAKDIMDQMSEVAPLAAAWHAWQGKITAFDNWNSDRPTSAAAGLNGQEGIIDNIEIGESGPVTAEWAITSHGGLSTEGYWAMGTAAEAHLSDAGISWTPSLDSKNFYIGLPTTLVNSPPNIEVARTLTTGDQLPIPGVFKVPVLSGTKVAAATIDGQPAGIMNFEDGTVGLVDTKNTNFDGRVVRYWLVGDDFSKLTFTHAVKPVSAKIGDVPFTDGESVRKVWDSVIPGFSKAKPQEQEELLHDYITSYFDYRLSPFAKSFNKSTVDLPAYTARIRDLHQGFCASINSLSALQTLGQQHNDVNLANGFLVGPDAKALTNRNGHAWRVDADSNTLDDTPFRNVLPEDAAWLNTPVGEVTSPVARPALEDSEGLDPRLPLGLMAATSALAIEIARRRSRDPNYKTMRHIAKAVRTHEKLLQTDEDLLRRTGHVLDAVLYDPKRDISAALQRGAAFIERGNSTNTATGRGRAANAAPDKATTKNHYLADKVLRDINAPTEESGAPAGLAAKWAMMQTSGADRLTKKAVKRIPKVLRQAEKVKSAPELPPTQKSLFQATLE